MAVFAYRAARADGTTFEGHIEGEDEHLVRAKLESDGLLVFRLAKRGAGFGVPGLSTGRWGKLPLQDFLVFNQELLALIKAGLPVLRVWDLLIDRTQRAPFREALKAVRQDIRGGASASEAMAKHSIYFSDLYLATIRAGEQSGNLSEVLQRYIAYLKLMIALRQKVTKAAGLSGFFGGRGHCGGRISVELCDADIHLGVWRIVGKFADGDSRADRGDPHRRSPTHSSGDRDRCGDDYGADLVSNLVRSIVRGPAVVAIASSGDDPRGTPHDPADAHAGHGAGRWYAVGRGARNRPRRRVQPFHIAWIGFGRE